MIGPYGANAVGNAAGGLTMMGLGIAVYRLSRKQATHRRFALCACPFGLAFVLSNLVIKVGLVPSFHWLARSTFGLLALIVAAVLLRLVHGWARTTGNRVPGSRGDLTLGGLHASAWLVTFFTGLGIDIKIRRGISKGSIAAVFVAALFVVSEAATRALLADDLCIGGRKAFDRRREVQPGSIIGRRDGR